jgi:hypothetical protein
VPSLSYGAVNINTHLFRPLKIRPHPHVGEEAQAGYSERESNIGRQRGKARDRGTEGKGGRERGRKRERERRG